MTVGVGWARLVVPAVAVLLVGVALNASWHAIQDTLRAVDAPSELVMALPAVLEPAALIYAWVTIDRRRTGRDATGVRWLLVAVLVAAVVYNVASALPLDQVLPTGLPGRMAVLAVSAALAPLTVVSVGHTALVEYAAWRTARRSLVDDVHAALEAEAQQALTGQLRGEFAAEVHTAVLTRLRAEMAAQLGVDRPSAMPDAVNGIAGHMTVTRTSSLSATVPAGAAWEQIPAVARSVIERHVADGGHVSDADLTAAVSDACRVSDRTARRYLAPVRHAAASG